MKLCAVAFLLLLQALTRCAEMQLWGGTTFRFATEAEARQILTNRDEFIARLSAFDRSARVKTDKPVSEEEFLQFIGTNVLRFERQEEARIQRSLAILKPKIEPLNLPWPETIWFVKTTGKEEGGAPYTRGSAIILPSARLDQGNDKSLESVICHELFHVLSRQNAALREKLYLTIGFRKCEE